MTGPLHQINVAYVAREDRLLMRVSTRGGEEFRIWLTRRFTGRLVDLLRGQMDRHGGAPSLASNQDTRRLFKQGAMNKSFDQEAAQTFPLGEGGILAFRAKTATADDGSLVLEIAPETDQGIKLNLNKTLLYLFYNLLTQGIDQ